MNILIACSLKLSISEINVFNIGWVDFHLYLNHSKIVRTLRNDVIGMIKSSLGKVLSPFRSHSESNGPGHC